jgi:hypothetical protein
MAIPNSSLLRMDQRKSNGDLLDALQPALTVLGQSDAISARLCKGGEV